MSNIVPVETNTLLLTRSDVASFLTIDDCIIAVEDAFKLYAEGNTLPPKVLGMHTDHGGFHIKTCVMGLSKIYFVAKINANFPGNLKQYDLPTIQGVIVVMDGTNGRLLALLDSIEITIARTGAATAVAAKYLSGIDASTVTICGCGNQGRISLKALMKVRSIKKAYVFDIDDTQTQKIHEDFSDALQVVPVNAMELTKALWDSEIIVTCTPSKHPFIHAEDIKPGAFIAAVGADSEEKQELFPELLSASKIVVDIAKQCAEIGELHHAIKQGLVDVEGIHAELGSVIAGKKPGRQSKEEIIVFDSTGTALQDVAVAAIVYEKASLKNVGLKLNFNEKSGSEVLKRNQKDISILSAYYPFR